MCGKQFVIKGSTLSQRNRSDRKQSGYFCSKSCSEKYGKLIQLGLIEPFNSEKIVPTTYKVKSAPKETLGVEAG